MGKVYEAMSLDNDARIAFYKALEIQNKERVRSLCCVLLESG